MPYSLFYTGVSVPSGQMPDLNRLMPMNFNAKDDAIVAACKGIKAGAVVWQISRPHGFVMERNAIECECWARANR
jgi:hypothetical protein